MGYSVYSSLLSLRLELGPLSATNLSLQLLTTPETPPPSFITALSYINLEALCIHLQYSSLVVNAIIHHIFWSFKVAALLSV